MEIFNKRKKDILSKLDKSNKGSIDLKIQKICNIINKKEEYFTTSSCSGRIVIIQLGDNKKKNSKWLFTSHELFDDFDNINEILNKINGVSEKNLWFKQEPMILHVCCKDIDSAFELWNLVQLVGYKRGGVRKGKQGYNVEIMGSEFIEAPIKNVNEEYLKELFLQGNKKMKSSFLRMKKLEVILNGEN